LLAPASVIRLLSETVPGLPDEGCHLQFENKGRRIEWRAPPAWSTRPRLHEHALPIGA